MSNAKYRGRHRQVRRPSAPIVALAESMSSVNLTPVRPAAFASVTGLALTAVVGGTAHAAPEAVEDPAVVPSTFAAANLPTTVSVPDLAWAVEDHMAVAVDAPAAEAPAPVVEAEPVAADRSETRADVDVVSSEAQQAALNAAGNDIVAIAQAFIGVPYVYGGSTPAGFDCSGFTQYVYALAGISIPRTTAGQGAAGVKVSYAEAQPGDIVWHAYGHVGIYAGNGMVIEATVPGDTVKMQPIWGYDAFIRY